MLQYLILHNHLESAKLYKQVSNLTWREQLISAFSKGHGESFFKIFQLLKKQEKLEFYLRVYFLIYPIHPNLSQNHKGVAIPEKQVNSFRDYLDTKGADLAKTSEFLQFYALPFIKKPLQHATFKTLFTKNWVSNLKQKLLSFIKIEQQSMLQAIKSFSSPTNHKNSTQKLPIAIKQVPETIIPQKVTTSSVSQQKFKRLQQTNKQLFKQIEEIQQKYKSLEQNHQSMIESFNEYMMESQNKWFDSYKQLVKTAKGLIQIIASTPLQNPKHQRRYIQSKRRIQKYEKFISKKLQDLMSVSQDISIFDKPSMNQMSQYTIKSALTSKSWLPNTLSNNITPTNNNNITSYVQIDEYIPTNFPKLNNQFLKLNENQQMTIIQGFCWRLIKAKTKQVRRYYCIGMIKGNFLGLGKKDLKSEHEELELCTKYLGKKNIVAGVLDLINYIKVDYYSRQYLFSQNNITWQLMEIMGQCLQDNDLQSFLVCLDIISTISAYQDYRHSVLQTQLPIFLLNILQSYPTIFESQQLMQLIIMILMNFSSFKQGLKMFEEYQNVFSTLSIIYEQGSHDIIMLVSGFYYSLLSNKRLYEIALESNMPEFIKYLLNDPQYKEHQVQLKYIQARLKRFVGDQLKVNAQNSQNDQDNQLYLVDGEEEYEQFEAITEEEIQNLQNYVKGHQLLSYKYGLKDKQADEQQNNVKKIDEEFAKVMAKKKWILNKNKLDEKLNNNKSDLKNQVQSDTKPALTKNIPQQSKMKRLTEMKSQQVQVSLISLGGKSKQVQSSIKEQVYSSPNSKIDTAIQTQTPIPKNSKQAQFMGYLNKQQNPTFAKQKSDNQQFLSHPMSENQNLPNFGTNKPVSQLGPQQKNRRKEILKQINEEIQIKKDLKTQKKNERIGRQKQKSKSISDNNALVSQNANFSKKKQGNQNEQDWSKGVRSNVHMKKQVLVDEKTTQQRQKQRKAFESKPKIVRTPPKQQHQAN